MIRGESSWIDTRPKLRALIVASEDWLIERILRHAKLHNYTKYTSTLKEAWRMSIAGLSDALIKALDIHKDIPELDPDADPSQDPCAQFGRIEAQRHRARGITLSMFLGLMKYYRQSYVELVRQRGRFGTAGDQATLFVDRFFDRVEIGFYSEWVGTNDERNLAELQNANRRLANEKNKFLTVFESLSVPVILIGADERVEHLNFAAAQLFAGALTPGALYYNPGVHNHEVSWLARELAAFREQAQRDHTFEIAIPEHGRDRHFEVRLCRMLDISDKFAGTLVILNDITARWLVEQQVEDANRELERKNAEMEQLVYTVSHDLKSPLVTISGFASYVQMDLQAGHTERLGEFIQRIRGATDRMMSLIEELLELSRVGRVAEKPVTVNIHRLVQDISALHQPSLAAKGITLIIGKTLGSLRADRRRLTQLFDNLITNAVSHGSSAPKPVIEIGLERGRDEVRYFVRDNGPGIPEHCHGRIFELFNRLNPDTPGTGVGLAIAKRIVEVLGGRIWVESKVGAGATFWFAIPASQTSSRPRRAPPILKPSSVRGVATADPSAVAASPRQVKRIVSSAPAISIAPPKL